MLGIARDNQERWCVLGVWMLVGLFTYVLGTLFNVFVEGFWKTPGGWQLTHLNQCCRPG